MENIKELLFSPIPSSEGVKYLPLLIAFGIIILLAIGSRLIKGTFSKLAIRYFTPFLTVGILGYINLFARYETLPWLGSGIVLLIVFLIFILTIIINTVWAVKNIPVMIRENKTKERFNKYLPQKKTK